jgi:hypothetical protein
MPFRFKCFLLTSSFQTKEKKKHNEKKKPWRIKKCRKRRELTSFQTKKKKKKHKERKEFTSCQTKKEKTTKKKRS